MAGERDLNKLIGAMSPRLIDGDYVFLSLADAKYGDYPELKPFAAIDEAEGLTLIVEHSLAIAYAFEFDGIYKGITLEVHSSLEAIGLTAAFAKALSDVEISANVIAGFYHDHIFVQKPFATEAMEALESLSSEHS